MKNILKTGTIVLSLTSFIHCNGPQGNQPGFEIPNNPRCEGAQSNDSTNYGGGDGTADRPYLICSVEQFKRISGGSEERKFFKLTTDLDFSEEKNLQTLTVTPRASIDGDNHRLKNLTIRHNDSMFGAGGGLYGQLVRDLQGNNPDEVKNLIIENATLLGTGQNDEGGIIAGANWGGIISNVHIIGTVQIEYPDSPQGDGYYVGGLVGKNAALIEDSSFEGTVSGVYNVGGIAGINEGTIRNSRAFGTVKGLKGIGGLVGVQLKPGVIENSTASSTVSGRKFTDQILGFDCPYDFYGNCGIGFQD